MFVVDTNVLVYAVDPDYSDFRRYRQLLEEWRQQSEAWFLTWSIVYEFVRITTHPGVFRRPWDASNAFAFVSALLEAPGLRILIETEQHAPVAAQTLREMPQLRGSQIHDAHIGILMREHGIRTIYTRDRGFKAFPFLDAIDPLSEARRSNLP